MRWLALWCVCGSLLAEAEELPVYPGTVHTRIGEDLQIGGERYRIAYFVTGDPLPQVADYFFQQWRGRGFPTVVDGDLVHEAVISAFYTREGLQRAVVLRLHQRRTVGFVVLKDLWSRSDVPEAVPVTGEGALTQGQELMVYESSGRARHRARVMAMKLPEAKAQVEGDLVRRGYQPAQTGPHPVQSHALWIEYTRGTARVVTALSEVGPGLVAVLETETDASLRAGKEVLP